MTIKEIRNLTGLSQRKFAEKYGIPYRNIENWETSDTSPNHRECQPYILKLLERVVREDMEKGDI